MSCPLAGGSLTTDSIIPWCGCTAVWLSTHLLKAMWVVSSVWVSRVQLLRTRVQVDVSVCSRASHGRRAQLSKIGRTSPLSQQPCSSVRRLCSCALSPRGRAALLPSVALSLGPLPPGHGCCGCHNLDRAPGTLRVEAWGAAETLQHTGRPPNRACPPERRGMPPLRQPPLSRARGPTACPR